jgi:hypothetical protein
MYEGLFSWKKIESFSKLWRYLHLECGARPIVISSFNKTKRNFVGLSRAKWRETNQGRRWKRSNAVHGKICTYILRLRELFPEKLKQAWYF